MFGVVLGSMMLLQSLDATGTALARPIGEAIFNPENGNTYQVFEFYGRPPHSWQHAQVMVRAYLHEGREGHLAFVKDASTHYFLLASFEMMQKKPMWIGLSAQCNEKADLKWEDGTSLEDTSFRAWSSVAQKKIRDACNRQRLSGVELPIYYDPSEFGVRWEMATPNTNITHMMVEFPPAEKATTKDKAPAENQ